MNKFMIVFVGLFAIGNAAIIRTLYDSVPLVSWSVHSNELKEWISYKEKFGKSYEPIEDRMRFNIFMATKEKIAKYDELIAFGLGTEKLELNIFADYTRDELFKLHSGLVDAVETEDEWVKYKIEFKKTYSEFEDRFRKTVFYIVKDTIEAHNKLYERSLVSYQLGINQFTDLFRDELPLGSYVVPVTAPVVGSRIISPFYDTWPNSAYRYYGPSVLTI